MKAEILYWTSDGIYNQQKLNAKATTIHKNNGTNENFYRKVAILMYTEMFNFRPEKQLRNQNHTEDWALGCHPHYNGHVTH